MRRDEDSNGNFETSVSLIHCGETLATAAISAPTSDPRVVKNFLDLPTPSEFKASEFEQRVEANHRQLNYQPMVVVLISVALGISIDRILDFSFWFYAGVGIASFGAFLVSRSRSPAGHPSGSSRCGYRDAVSSGLLLLSFVALGSGWQHGRWNWFATNEIGLYAGVLPAPASVEGRLASEPRLLGKEDQSVLNPIPPQDRTRILLYPEKIRIGNEWHSVKGRVDLVVHQDARHLHSGDVVRVTGQIVKIHRPTNPGQMDFSRAFREKQQLAVLHTYSNDSVQLVRETSRPGSWVSRLRRQLNKTIWSYLGEERAGLASAILLGNREQLTSDRRERFMVTGTVHLLAISGLHVGILAGAFFLLYRLGLLSRSRFLWATIFFVLFYTWLVEFRPPVSRAAILIILVCLGRLMGRRSLTFNWLAIAGLVVLAINPNDLFRLGPQLSFLAVATIVFGKDWMFWPRSTDPIVCLIANSRPFHVRAIYWLGRKFRAAVLVSAIIWVVGMPLVAANFHLLAPISLVVNPLLLIPVALALYCGMGVMVFGWLCPPLAWVAGWICDWNLSVVESTIGWAEQIPWGHTWTAGPTVLAVVVFYLVLLVVAVYPPTRLKWTWCLAVAATWFVFGWSVPDAGSQIADRYQTEELQGLFVDVGHGTSVIVKTPSGKTILYDSGRMGSVRYGVTNISSVLWHQRVSYIDAIFVSHADVDHFNAIPGLAKRFGIGCVYISSAMQGHNSRAVKGLFESLESYDIPVKTIDSRNQIELDETSLRVLGPPKLGTDDTDNSNSLVLMIESHDQKLLLCGDLERSGMQCLLGQFAQDCDVAMAPHHGSKNSVPGQFADWATPEIMIVSASQKRLDHEVIDAWRDQGIKVFSTAKDGAIRVLAAESGVRVHAWNNDRWK